LVAPCGSGVWKSSRPQVVNEPWQGGARLGRAGHGRARHGVAGRGEAGHGWAGPGKVVELSGISGCKRPDNLSRKGSAARLGGAGQGAARHGRAGQGWAGQGRAGQGKARWSDLAALECKPPDDLSRKGSAAGSGWAGRGWAGTG
jgi:hypothetical protein